MAIEIERKFLLAAPTWREEAVAPPVPLIQGYFVRSAAGPTVRVRIAGERAFLTVKGRSVSWSRSEFEYEIPVADADAMLAEFCGNRIVRKLRRVVPEKSGLHWEIDEYLDANAGLFTAEIELPDPDRDFDRPAWLGAEITADGRYSNGALSCAPYREWSEK